LPKFHFQPRWQSVSNVRPFALIVGATGAIGFATARAFASLGFSLVLCARDSDASLDTLRERLMRVPIDSENNCSWIGAAPRVVHAVRFDLESDVPTLRFAIDEAIANVPIHWKSRCFVPAMSIRSCCSTPTRRVV
jgi:NAD(P)-dependent dehydrogenase (short-subunit alcohol dehydrogenase family)